MAWSSEAGGPSAGWRCSPRARGLLVLLSAHAGWRVAGGACPATPGSLAPLLHHCEGSTQELPLLSSGLEHDFPVTGCLVSLFRAPLGLLVARVWGPFPSAPDLWNGGWLRPPFPLPYICMRTHMRTHPLIHSHAYSTVAMAPCGVINIQ